MIFGALSYHFPSLSLLTCSSLLKLAVTEETLAKHSGPYLPPLRSGSICGIGLFLEQGD
jgi:hypothetical protein